MVFPGFYSIVKLIPGGPRFQVFVGTAGILTLSAIPIYMRDSGTTQSSNPYAPPPKEKVRRGHGYFDSEKPVEIEEAEADRARVRRKELVENFDSKR